MTPPSSGVAGLGAAACLPVPDQHTVCIWDNKNNFGFSVLILHMRSQTFLGANTHYEAGTQSTPDCMTPGFSPVFLVHSGYAASAAAVVPNCIYFAYKNMITELPVRALAYESVEALQEKNDNKAC